ncbi:MAG: helix-turn-helix domain-containing protein [Ruminococcaceae bacterium]|nr:helix-turn-helix domain-containing protein [Oscillospiraceae bacterium]
MKSKWMVLTNYFGNEERYIVYRLLNEKDVMHAGNVETHGRYMFDRNEAKSLADKLNRIEQLRSFRQAKGLTKPEMADRLGVTLSLYEKVEGGHAGVSAKFMRKMKSVFPEVNIDKMFF